MIELEDAVMEIIVNAGQSRSLCFEALHCARNGNIDEARLLLNEADGCPPGAPDADPAYRAGRWRSAPADDVNYGPMLRIT